MTTLRIDLRIGESVRIGPHAVVTLEQKSGQMAKLAFEADPSVRITRIGDEAPKIGAAGGMIVDRA